MKLTEVADGVIAVHGTDVNWTILRDGRAFTLVDTGYPRYARAVRESIRRAGLDVAHLEAIVVSHAHIDHIGGVPELLRDRPVPVHVGAPEQPMAIGAWTESAGPIDVAMNLWRPRFIPWSARITLAGGAGHVKVPESLAVADGATLDIPGQPTAVLTPGHTSGHLCLQVGNVLLSGDALVTGHAVSGRTGPQLLATLFHTDVAQARASLAILAERGTSVLVPGHGPVWHGPIADLVEDAR